MSPLLTPDSWNPLTSGFDRQIASRMAAGDLSGFLGVLPNPDPVLRAMGRSISVYRNLLADPLVMGLRRRRIAAVLAMKRGFHPDKCKLTPRDLRDIVEKARSFQYVALARNGLQTRF